jgi:hypothetical protein
MPIRLRPLNAAGGVAVGALTFATLGTGLAGAQTTEQIEISPSGGPPGTPIAVSGSGCTGIVEVLLANGDTLDDDEVLDVTGDWTASVEVPDEDELHGMQLTITAECLGVGPEYGAAFFEVDPDDTPSTTEPPSTTPTTGPPAPGGPGAPGGPSRPSTPAQPGGSTTTTTTRRDAPAPMPPATPVRGEPSYTG